MPPQLEARRSERVDYKADVELLARDGASASPLSFLAHALDLGSGGMRLSTRAQMPVGAEVMCRFTLDGRPAALPGRVVWCREPHADEAGNAHGMGVCFESLGAYESGLLRQVVERSNAGYRPVELHFAGIPQPVIARARSHGDGLRLSAALPIFARGAELSFQLDEEGPHFTGRIGDATLREENGVRRIDIDIDVAGDTLDDSDKRDRRRARYGYAEEIQAEEQQQQTAAAHPPAEADATQRIPARSRVAPRSRPLVLPMFVAALVGGTLAWSAASRWSASDGAAQAEFVARPLPLEPAVAAAAAVAAVAAPAPEPEPAPTEVELASTSGASIAPAPALRGGASIAPAPALRGGASIAPAPALRGGASTPTMIVPESETAQAPSQHKPRLPESTVDANATRIRLPFDGSLEGMRSTIWAEPAALAIDLPHGATTLEPGRYPIDDGGVTDLRVNKNRHSLLLRIRLAEPVARYAIALEDGVLEAQLQRPRVSHSSR